MIISCPSCATRYDWPSRQPPPEGMTLTCRGCGHSWIEARSLEVIDVVAHEAPRGLPPPLIDHGFEPEGEVSRLMEAAREAREAHAERRRRRLRSLQAWGIFAALATSPFAAAAALPEQVVKVAPAAIGVYARLGYDVNIYGLEVRRVEQQHVTANGTRVLTIKGDIANTTSSARKIPWLRFALLAANGKDELYHWTLDTGARPLRPGEVTGFITRVASPPETAGRVQIRFAHADEIGSNAGHE